MLANDAPHTTAGNDAMSDVPSGVPPLGLNRRRQMLTALALVVGVLALTWAVWQWLVSRHLESTDNAYVQGTSCRSLPRSVVPCSPSWPTTPISCGPASRWCGSTPPDATLARTSESASRTGRPPGRALYAENATLAAQVVLRQAEAALARSEAARAATTCVDASRSPTPGPFRARS